MKFNAYFARELSLQQTCFITLDAESTNEARDLAILRLRHHAAAIDALFPPLTVDGAKITGQSPAHLHVSSARVAAGGSDGAVVRTDDDETPAQPAERSRPPNPADAFDVACSVARDAYAGVRTPNTPLAVVLDALVYTAARDFAPELSEPVRRRTILELASYARDIVIERRVIA